MQAHRSGGLAETDPGLLELDTGAWAARGEGRVSAVFPPTSKGVTPDTDHRPAIKRIDPHPDTGHDFKQILGFNIKQKLTLSRQHRRNAGDLGSDDHFRHGHKDKI